jgi:hypothetical protein
MSQDGIHRGDMILPRHIELLHDELDGVIDEAGRAELAALLQRSPEARACREQLHEVAEALRSAPMPPVPATLRQRILDALPAVGAGAGTTTRPQAGQADSGTNPRHRRNTPGQAGHAGHPHDHLHSQRSRAMSNTTNKKALVIGLAASIVAVAGGVALFGDRLPHGNQEMAAGTIAPAQRYQASQVTAADVQLGDQSAAQFMQTDAYRHIMGDPAMRAAMSNDAFRAALANDAFRAALQNDAFRAALASDAFRAALQSDAFRMAMSNDAFRAALQSDAFRMALQSDAFRAAMASDAFRAAVQKEACRDALLNDALRAALQSEAFR